jgi:thiol-disulfide isomerase/thioredoxin
LGSFFFEVKVLNHILRIVLGLVFVLSGLAKLFPIEPFEIIFVDLGVSNWLYAPFVARFIIAFEIFLGLSIVFNNWIKNIVYYVALYSLGLFTAYLIYLLIAKGNNVDCGCFGSFLALTPVESIVKNVVLIIMLLLIKRRYHTYGIVKWLPILFLAIAFTSTFLLNRVGLQNAQGIELNKAVDYSELPPLYLKGEKIDFTKGDKIVAFLSVTCPHCESAAHKLTYLQSQYKIDNLYIVIGSKEEKNIQPFIDRTKIDFPLIWINNNSFFKYSGGRLPAFVYLEEGTLKKKWTGEFFKVEELEELLVDSK